MWATERKRRIMEILATHRQVSAGRLSELLGVSRETVRRDLVELEGTGRVRRVHGGVVLPEPAPEAPFDRRLHTRAREKREIAGKAVQLIRPGQCIMVDAGSTTSMFARELARVPDIMVVTNSFDIATIVQGAGVAAEVVLLGGRLMSDVPATYGSMTQDELGRFRADIAFIAPVALDPAEGAFHFELHEAELAAAMMARAEKVVMLADRDKLANRSRVRCCGPGDIDTLVTDAGAPAELCHRFEKAGIRVLN